ncbi:MAG: L-threonylcarbamoyladenylate synthase [Ornithinimicrobium sp.]
MILDCHNETARADAVAQAAEVVRSGRLIVMPTDTVYGIGADAFDAVAVAMVLAAKHRSRDMPPPVLVPSPRTVDGLASDVPLYAKILIRAFWPGALTVVLRAQSSLAWDLGKTNGTVALRMPQDSLALDVLSQVGPMAVTSANLTGQPAATTAQEAHEQLRGAVSIYLDDGPRQEHGASTIVDCTGEEPVVLRHGSLSAESLREVLGDTVLHDAPPAPPQEAPEAVEPTDDRAEPSADTAESGPSAPRRPAHGPHLVGSVRGSGIVVDSDALRALGPTASQRPTTPPTVGS